MSSVREITSAYEIDGMTVDDIAAETGHPIPAVKRFLVQGGVETPLCADDRFMLALMGPIFQGRDADIAEVMGVPVTRVNRLRLRMGIGQ